MDLWVCVGILQLCFLQDQEIEDLSKSIHSIYMILESKMYLVSILNSGKSIDDFLAYYCANFPQASVTPKMHTCCAFSEGVACRIWFSRGAGC